MPLPPPDPLLAPCYRWLGPPLAGLFALAGLARRTAYRAGCRWSRTAPLPVLSVGNLTVGGTGKSPTVAYLAGEAVRRGLARRPAVVLRGYGAARAGELNDEARELLRAHPDLTVIAQPDRFAGATAAAGQGCDLVILDDGFQHWQLARQFDLVLLDASDPFGGGHLAPWGRLREPPRALARAHAVLLTRCALAGPEAVAAAEARARALAPHAVLARADHAPRRLRRLFGPAESAAPEALRGRPALAACGLAHPRAFFATLATLGVPLAATAAYADHHLYDAGDVAALVQAAQAARAEAVVVTEKDAAKLEALAVPPPALPFWSLAIALEVTHGAAELWAQIAKALGH